MQKSKYKKINNWQRKFCISQKTVETHKKQYKSEAQLNYFNITEDIKKKSNLIDAPEKTEHLTVKNNFKEFRANFRGKFRGKLRLSLMY